MSNQVTKKSWEEFRASGLGWWINSLLHVFGWAIVFEVEDNKVIGCYPARVSYRGFDEQSNSEGYQKVTEYLKENIADLQKEIYE